MKISLLSTVLFLLPAALSAQTLPYQDESLSPEERGAGYDRLPQVSISSEDVKS